MDEALKEAKKQARFAPTLPEKLERQRAARKLEEKREEAWRAYDEASPRHRPGSFFRATKAKRKYFARLQHLEQMGLLQIPATSVFDS